MSFFDSKEEVLKIELTQYGKYLLSKGKFTPKYYHFFDDDVLYDSNYGNLEEKQNDSQQRILNETPNLKPQAYFSSVEKTKGELTELGSNLTKKTKQSGIDHLSMPYPIGSSGLNSQYLPAWNISVISGSLANSSNFYYRNNVELPGSSYIKVPQLNLESGIFRLSSVPENYTLNSEEELLESINGGRNIIYSLENMINIFDIVEKNVDDKKENFMLEVFIENDGEWEQLHFMKKPQEIKNNILLDDRLYEEYIDPSTVDASMVEYYFDFFTDMEVLPKTNRAKTPYNSPVSIEDQPFGDKC